MTILTQHMKETLDGYIETLMNPGIYTFRRDSAGKISLKYDQSVQTDKPVFAFTDETLTTDIDSLPDNYKVALARLLSKKQNPLDRLVQANTPDPKALLGDLSDLTDKQIGYICHTFSGPRAYPHPHLNRLHNDTGALLCGMAITVKKNNENGGNTKTLPDVLKDTETVDSEIASINPEALKDYPDFTFYTQNNKEYKGRLISAAKDIIKRIKEAPEQKQEQKEGEAQPQAAPQEEEQ